MTPNAYQILTPLISFVAVAYVWNLALRHRKTIWEAILWTLFWGSIALIAIFPASIDYLKLLIGVQKRENAVMVTVLGILSFMMFYLIVRVEELEQRQTRLVRKIALKDVEKDS